MKSIENFKKYNFVFKILLKRNVPKKFLQNYLNDEGDYNVIILQEFCVNNSRIPFTSGINIIDAADIFSNKWIIKFTKSI